MAKTTKQTELSRIQAFFFLLFFLGFAISTLCGGYLSIIELWSNNSIISYHKLTFILLIFSVIFFLVCVGVFYAMITGKQAPKYIQTVTVRLILILFFISIITFPISNFYATSLLEKRGYILCPRVLGESVVGGGRTWALSEKLCLENRLERESSTRNRLEKNK